MSIKMELTDTEILTIKTPEGTVLVSYLPIVGTSVAFYANDGGSPVSAVHIHTDGDVDEIHCPKDVDL